ncbi:MAG: hypothetical protein IJ043_03070 [Clostridia bacterium]|nr:hypothetical protein [Clostridia bacterium]
MSNEFSAYERVKKRKEAEYKAQNETSAYAMTKARLEEKEKAAERLQSSGDTISALASHVSGRQYSSADALRAYRTNVNTYIGDIQTLQDKYDKNRSYFDSAEDFQKAMSNLEKQKKYLQQLLDADRSIGSFADEAAYTKFFQEAELQNQYSGKTYEEIQKALADASADPERSAEAAWLKSYGEKYGYADDDYYAAAVADKDRLDGEIQALQQEQGEIARRMSGYGRARLLSSDAYKKDQARSREIAQEIGELEGNFERLEAARRQYERENVYELQYAGYAEKEDFDALSRQRTFNNPTVEDFAEWDTISGNGVHWVRDENGERSLVDIHGNKLDENYDANYAPDVQDKLGLYLNAAEDEKADASANTAETSTYMRYLNEGVQGSWDQLKKEEIGTYYYLLNSEGQESAYRFLEEMQTELNRRSTEAVQQKIDKAGALAKVAYNVASFSANVYGGVVSSLDDALHQVQGKEINPYSAAHSLTNFASAVREETGKDIAAAADFEIFGQNVPEFLYQTVMSMGDSALGAYTLGGLYLASMGMNATSNEARRLYEAGASREQILFGSLLAGIAEAVAEKIPLDNLLSDKGILSVKELVIKQAGIEATEEMATEIANTVTNSMVMGANSDLSNAVAAYMEQGMTEEEARNQAFIDKVVDVGWAGLGGALSGAGMGGATGAVQYNLNNLRTGEAVDQTAGAGELVAKTVLENKGDYGSKLYKLAQKQVASKNKDSLAYHARLGKLVNQSRSALINGESAATTKTNIANRLQELGVNRAETAAGAIFKSIVGENVSPVESELLIKNEAVKKVLAEAKYELNNGLTSPYRNAAAQFAAAATGDAEQVAVLQGKKQGILKATVQGKAVQLNPKQVVASVADGKVKLNTSDGVAAMEEAEITRDIQVIIEKGVRNGMTAEEINGMVAGYDSTRDAEYYAAGYTEAFNGARIGKSRGMVVDDSIADFDISYDVAHAAFDAGSTRRISDIEKASTQKAEAVEAEKAATGRKIRAREGVVRVKARITAERRVMLSFAKLMAKNTGVDIVLYDGRAPKYADKNGVYRHYRADGHDEIWINADSGGGTLMLTTLAHELTHFMEENNPKEFENYKNFLMEQVGETRFQELLQQKKNRGMASELAVSEVVAELSEDLLNDGSAIRKLAETDLTTAQKIKKWIDDFLAKLLKAFEGYHGRHYELIQEAKVDLKAMQKLFNDALAIAVENYNAEQSQGAGKTEKTDAEQYSEIGIADDGKKIYESNFPKGTPKSAKSKRILDYIKNVWSKNPIKLVISNGETSRTIFAKFDPTVDESQNTPTDASKIAGGNRHGNHTEQRVTLDLADDYYQIASEAKYNYSKRETGKTTETHRDVNMWHYFVNDIYFAEYGEKTTTPYTVTINVKEKSDGNFVYSFNAEKESSTRQTLHAAVNTVKGANGELFVNDNVPQSDTVVNSNSTQVDEKYSSMATEEKTSVFNESAVSAALYDSLYLEDKGDNNLIKVSTMPKYVQGIFGIDGDFYIYRNHAYENMVTEEEAKENGRYSKRAHYHGLGIDTMTEAMLSIENPLITFVGKTKEGNPMAEMILPVFDQNGSPLYAILSFYANRGINGSWNRKPHVLLTISNRDLESHPGSGRKSTIDSINSAILEGKIVDFDEKNRAEMSVIAQHARLGNITKSTLDKNLSQFLKEVKRFKEENKINYSEGLLSRREILSDAFTALAETEGERERLAEYRKAITKIEEYEAQLAEVRSKLKEKSFAPGKRNQAAIDDLTAQKAGLEKLIDRWDKRLIQVEAAQPLKDLFNRAMAQASKKARAEGREALKRGRESRSKTALRGRIRKELRELDQLLNRGSKERNVKAELRDTVSKALAAGEILFYDTVSNADIVWAGVSTATEAEQKQLNRYRFLLDANEKTEDPAVVEKNKREIYRLNKLLSGVFERERNRYAGEKAGTLLSEISTAYEGIKNSSNSYISGAYDETVRLRLDDLALSLEGIAVQNMTVEQLRELNDAFTAVLHTVKNANKLFREGRQVDLQETATAVLNEIGTLARRGKGDLPVGVGEAMEKAKEFIWQDLKPVYAFERIGSEALKELYWDAVGAEGTYYRDIRAAGDFMEEKKAQYRYKDWDRKTSRSFRLADGLEFRLNLPQMMSVYAYSKREKALKHMAEGGFMFAPGESYKAKKAFLERNQNTTERYRMDPMVLAEIRNALTEEQRAYVDEMQEYLSKTMGAKGNEVSRQLYGVDLFKEEHYFPMKSEKDFISSVQEALSKTPTQASLKNTGMARETVPNANNAIVLQGFDDVWIGHVDQMSQYHALVLPVENLMKVFNYKGWNDQGKEISVKNTLNATFGSGAERYLDGYITDLNGGIMDRGYQAPLMGMFSKFKKAAVGLSASTVVQQPTAILRAMSEIRPDYFIPFFRGQKTDGLYREMLQYAPIAGIKEMGGFDTGSSRQAKDYIGITRYGKDGVKAFFHDREYRAHKLDSAYMWGATKADQLGWMAIWSAVKKEVADRGYTGDYLEACGKRFTEVIVYTQVYDSVNSRSGIMRSKNDFNKAASAFMGEPTTSINMLYHALLQVKRAPAGQRGKATLKAARTIGSVYASVIAAAALASAVYAMRDEDEDEEYGEKYTEHFWQKLLSEINPLNMIPYFNEIISLFEGWNVERPDMALISDLITAGKKLTSDTVPTEKKIKEFTGAFAAAFGIPLKNLMKDAEGLWRTVRIAVMGPAESVDHFTAEGTLAENKAYINALIEVKSKTAVKSAFTRKYKEAYTEAYRQKDYKQCAEIGRILRATGLYEDVSATLENWLEE